MKKLLIVLALFSMISMSFKSSPIDNVLPPTFIVDGRSLADDIDFQNYVNTSIDLAHRLASSNSISSFIKMKNGVLTEDEQLTLASKLQFSDIISLNTFLLTYKETTLRVIKKYPELSDSKSAKILKEALEILRIENHIKYKVKRVPLCDAILGANLGTCSTILYAMMNDGNPYNDDQALIDFSACLNLSYIIYYICEGA